jgi:soluble lytic murein transglycosylase-like protein
MLLTEALCTGILMLGIATTPQHAEYVCTHVPQIIEISAKLDLRPELIIAVIHHESRFRPHAVSSAGACGLMQVLPKFTGNRAGGTNRKTGVPKLTCTQLKDPTTAITYGSMTLKYWIKGYGRGNLRTGLCGYNAGFRCKGESPHPMGVRYANAVLHTYHKLKRQVKKLSAKR